MGNALCKRVAEFVTTNDGVLPVRPAWVPKKFLCPGKRLGLAVEDYDCGERGQIMERWLCSVTSHDSPLAQEYEGESLLAIDDCDISLRNAIDVLPEIVGIEYYQVHHGLDRLIKLFDYGVRLPFHIHQRQCDLDSQGKKSKDEAYHFLDADPGPHPETFIGVHPYIVKEHLQNEIFLPILKEWKANDAEVLKHSTAYYCTPGEGFLLNSGLLHAPGSVLTFEIQESSDVAGFFQPVVDGFVMDKRILLKDVAIEDQLAWGPEEAALRQVDWEANINPNFYEQFHLFPRICEETRQDDLYETWIFYGTPKFSGKRLILPPGRKFRSVQKGVHNLFCWKGEGDISGHCIKAGKLNRESCSDELLICHDRAVRGYDIINTGKENLVLYLIFGPEINNECAPKIEN